MHQSTADLANLLGCPDSGYDLESLSRVTVLTIVGVPADRYAPPIELHPVVTVHGTGLQRTNINLKSLRRMYRAIVDTQPTIVHFNSPHIWNPILLLLLRRARIPTIQTIHDLDPHSGTGYGRLLYIWNNLVVRLATHILVHGQIFQSRLIRRGVPPAKITCVPLLHLFLSYEKSRQLTVNENFPVAHEQAGGDVAAPFALFFARIEAYKGVDILIEAMRQIEAGPPHVSALRVIIAGGGDLQHWAIDQLPGNVEIRNRLIKDDEAIELFRCCSLVVLPYIDATQSALIASAYFFGKPVIITHVGALPEYVIDGETGWIIEPRNPEALAECLRKAFSDPARLIKMGQAGRAWYWAQRLVEHRTLVAMYRQMAASNS